MPYILEQYRDLLDPSIRGILHELNRFPEAARGGALDYIVFRLLRELTREQPYHVQRGYYGDVLWAAQEWYARFARPYEDAAIKRNGDIT
jgi:hypothetical protein